MRSNVRPRIAPGRPTTSSVNAVIQAVAGRGCRGQARRRRPRRGRLRQRRRWSQVIAKTRTRCGCALPTRRYGTIVSSKKRRHDGADRGDCNGHGGRSSASGPGRSYGCATSATTELRRRRRQVSEALRKPAIAVLAAMAKGSPGTGAHMRDSRSPRFWPQRGCTGPLRTATSGRVSRGTRNRGCCRPPREQPVSRETHELPASSSPRAMFHVTLPDPL